MFFEAELLTGISRWSLDLPGSEATVRKPGQCGGYGLPSIFVNKVLSAHSYGLTLSMCHQWLLLCCHSRPMWPTKLNIITFWPFTEKSMPTPCLRIFFRWGGLPYRIKHTETYPHHGLKTDTSPYKFWKVLSKFAFGYGQLVSLLVVMNLAVLNICEFLHYERLCN